MRRVLESALFVVAGLSFSVPSAASSPNRSNFVFIGRGAGGSADAYFLPGTFRRIDSRTRSAEIVLSYDKPRFGLTPDLNDDPAQRFQSYKSTYYVRCEEGLMATAFYTQLSEQKGAGVVVGKVSADAPPNDAFFRKPTDIYSAYPIDSTIVKTICAYNDR